MALITRTINNTGSPLTDVNGAVLALTPIRFTLVNARSYSAGTFDATTGEPVAPGPYLATTDEDGLFSVDLWPTSRGLEERFYLVEIAPDSDTVEFPAFKSPLADGAGDLPFLSFRLGGDTVEEWELDAFTAHVNNMDLHTPSGTGHTHDNKAILDQISESVGKLTYNGSLVGISDHGGMTGLSDDDHTQYLNSTRHSAITGNPHSTTPADIGAATAAHTHAGVYEPANANIQSHINSIANPHSVTAAQVGIANKSTLDKITESAGLPLWNGTAWPGGSAGGGDMYKSAYDTDNDGIVDAAESAPWAGITGKPSTYPPESHTHDDRYYTESEVNSLLGGKSDTTHNHSGVYQPVMGTDDNYVTDAEKSALHSHSNKTALDAVSGTNTGDQDLSGYSLTSHNHSLNSLTEKSYNSLTDKPSIPSIAGLLDETAHDLLDHTGLTGIPAAYTLPTASTTVLGGVKVDGATITITDSVISATASGGMTAESKSSSFSAVADTRYVVSTSGGAVTATLPPNPVVGDYIEFIDAGSTWAATDLVLARNGLKINGATTDFICDADNVQVSLTYTGASYGWAVKIGASVLTAAAHATGSHSDWPAAVSMTEVGYLDGLTAPAVGTTQTQTLTNKTIEAASLTNGYTEEVYNLTGTEINPTNGSIQYKTLSGDTTFTEALADGQSVTLMLNPATYTTTWPTTTWIGSVASTAPTLVASVYNCITFFQFGGTLYGKYEGRV